MLPYAALAFGVLALSFSSLFIRWSDAPGPVTSFYRFGFAALIMLPIAVQQMRKMSFPPLQQIILQPRLLVFPLAAGVFSTLDHGTWSIAIDYTRVANATLLNNMSPLWVALFAALVWRERLTGAFWLGLVITLVGASVVIGADFVLQTGMTGGNLLALLSSVFYAGYFLVTQRGREHMAVLPYIWLVSVFGALGLLVFSLILGMPLSGFSGITWLIFLAAALITQVGGYFAIAYALGHLPASVVAPTLVLQPVLTALLAIPLAGESLSTGQWLGGLAVVGGVYLVNNRGENL